MKKQEYVETILSDIDDRYIEESLGYMEKQKKRRGGLRRPGVWAACFCAVCALVFSSLSAATVAGSARAYDLLYLISPEIAGYFSPVNMSCVDDGIEMEVKAVYVHGDSADIYISMKDLTGDRIDEGTDLFDSCEILTAADFQTSGCSLAGYDAEKKEAIFLLTVQQPGSRISGEKLTVRVSRLLSGKRQETVELPQIDLEHAQEAEELLTLEEIDACIRGWGENAGEGVEISNVNRILDPDAGISLSPVDKVTVTGYGFVDGKLHIQAHYDEIREYDNHGTVWLSDGEGNEVPCSLGLSFWDEEGTGSYDEYIFDIDPDDDLSGYSVWGYFATCQSAYEGNWSVTFPVKNNL